MARLFSKEHHWIELQDGVATVGLTAAGAAELGQATFVELPPVGGELSPGEVLCVIESAKAAVEVLSPIGGRIVEVNDRMEDAPDLVGSAPESEGWLCRLEVSGPPDLSDLMDEAAYEAFLAGG